MFQAQKLPRMTLPAQLLLGCAALAVMMLAPPADGPILIVSLSREAPGDIARWAIAQDVRLLGVGPLPNSMVVVGSRSALFEAAIRHGGLLMTGAFAGCGG